MKKLLIALLFMLQYINLPAQYYTKLTDSIVSSIPLGANDWVIALTYEQAGLVPLFDSLGNIVNEDPTGTYIISKINNHCTLGKLTVIYERESLSYKISRQADITGNTICRYTTDSIKKAYNEWIYPSIFFNDSLKTYDIQENADHSPFYQFYFRTSDTNSYKNFGEINIVERTLFFAPEPKNLNYNHNVNTFVYRAFKNIMGLLKKHFKVYINENLL